jgi:chitin synthase
MDLYKEELLGQVSAAADSSSGGSPLKPMIDADRAPLSAFCVTVYNESDEVFRATLVSLLASLQHFYRTDRRRNISVLCIIIDGRESLHPRLLELLQSSGLISRGNATTSEGTESYSSLHRLEAILDFFAGKTPAPHASESRHIQITVRLKLRNQGKLHSHHVFFNSFPRAGLPSYCFQIDVGTVLAQDSVLKLIRLLDVDPALAAVAPRVMTAAPTLSQGYIAEWQYLDFAQRAAVSWPFEVTTGFLSVIPGQAGVFRWNSLQGAEPALGAAEPQQPLSIYLRGMFAERPLEKIMYLAEDRVIGAAVVLSGLRDWRLTYLAEATAVTDSCQSFRELLRQRRRWNNSSLACRYWLLGQWRSIVSRRDRSSRIKIRLLTALIAQSLLALQELLLPTQLIAVCFIVASVASNARARLDGYVVDAFWGLLAAELALTAIATQPSLVLSSRTYAIIRNGVGLAAGGLFLIVACLVLRPAAVLIFFGPALAVIAMAPVVPAPKLVTATRTHLLPLANLLTSSCLLFYALWNLDDVSWGTKGLTRSAGTRQGRMKIRRVRDVVLLLWIVANVCASALALVGQRAATPGVNLVTAFIRGFELLQVLVALLYLGRLRLDWTFRLRRRAAVPNDGWSDHAEVDEMDEIDFRHGCPNELDALLLEARDRGVDLTLSGGRLRFNAPSGAMTDSLRSRLSERREEIARALRGPEPRQQGPVENAPFLYHYHELFNKVRAGEVGVNFTNATNWVARLTGRFDPRALQAGLRSLVNRCPILGARVALRDGVPHFAYSGDVQFYYADRSDGEGEAWSQEIQSTIDLLTWRPFDLDRDALFRVFVLKVGPRTHVIGFVIHHFIGDAVSVSIVAREIFQGYAAAMSGADGSAALTSLQYGDYLIEMGRWLLQTGLRYRLDRWMRHLQGVRRCCLPADFNVPEETPGVIRTELLELAPALAVAAQELAVDIGTTVFTVFLAAYYCTLRHALGYADLVILTLHHGREHPELMRVVGSFQNQIPLRIQARPDLAFCDLVRQLHADCHAAYERQVPYGNILHELERNGTPHVFPELNCRWNGTAGGRTYGNGSLQHQPTTPPEFHSSAKHHPYHVVGVSIGDSSCRLEGTYLDALYGRDTFRQHLSKFAGIALLAIRRPQTSICELCAETATTVTADRART